MDSRFKPAEHVQDIAPDTACLPPASPALVAAGRPLSTAPCSASSALGALAPSGDRLGQLTPAAGPAGWGTGRCRAEGTDRREEGIDTNATLKRRRRGRERNAEGRLTDLIGISMPRSAAL